MVQWNQFIIIYTGAKIMERKRFLPLLAVILFIWALWRYEAALALLGFFFNLIMPFIIGGCLAFIINVPLVHIERLWQKLFARFHSDWPQKVKRPVCLIVTLTVIIGVVLIGGLKIGPDLHQSFNMIVKTLPQASAEVTLSLKERWAELALSPDTLDYLQAQWSELLHALDTYWETNKTTLFYNTLNITTSIISLISNIVIGAVFAVYLLLSKEKIANQTRDLILAFCSSKRAAYLLDLGRAAHAIFSGYIGGQLLEAFCLGLLCLAGMLLLGLPYALSISVIVGFLAIIPIIGTIISALLGLILIGLAAPGKIWLFILFFFVLQRIEGDVLYPKIVGKSVGLSEIWVLAAITVGGSLAGVLGIIVSVPAASVLAYIFSQNVRQRLKEKDINPELE
jgi:predicted PurR-regulated permease PerM